MIYTAGKSKDTGIPDVASEAQSMSGGGGEGEGAQFFEQFPYPGTPKVLGKGIDGGCKGNENQQGGSRRHTPAGRPHGTCKWCPEN